MRRDSEKKRTNNKNSRNSRNRWIIITGVCLLLLLLFFLSRDGKAKDRKKYPEDILTVGECIYSIETLLGEELLKNFAQEAEPSVVGMNTMTMSGSYRQDTQPVSSGRIMDIATDSRLWEITDPMSGQTFSAMLERIGMETQSREKLIQEYGGKKRLDREEWFVILQRIAVAFGMEQTMEQRQAPVFDVMEAEQRKPVITDEGVYSYYAGATCLVRDQMADWLVRGDTILFVRNVHREACFYENVLIEQTQGEMITVRLNGIQRVFAVKGLTETLENVTADIRIEYQNKQAEVTMLQLKRDYISGKLLAVLPEGIEVEGYGTITLSPKCRYYNGFRQYDGADAGLLVVGREDLQLVVAKKQICAVVARGENTVESIRVLLKNTGYQSLFHDNVSLSCQGRYRVSSYTWNDSGEMVEIVSEHEGEEVLKVLPDDVRLQAGRIRVTPLNGEAKVVLHSVERNCGFPEYRGTIEISLCEGQLVLINEVSLEEYLYAVVPSEMPSSYGVEALKVQAVCARSYAVSHLSDGRLQKYGAQIDDSTDYQVYNNTGETENAILAVNGTAGEILVCDGNVANTYFFATSCGSTTDATIWGDTSVSYLQGRLLSDHEENLDLTSEVQFAGFIRSEYDSFDKENAWYRWHCTMSTEQLSAAVNGKLQELGEKMPDKILVKQPDGSYESRPVTNVGRILHISVEKRLTGGVADEVVIEGEAATVKVCKQSAIRNLINPYGITIHKQDGSTTDTFTALPSAFFIIEQNGDSITFYGGGFGHGVGMSQTAVKAMVDQNWRYEDILRFFYEGVSLGSD